jgi:hypothetical protein
MLTAGDLTLVETTIEIPDISEEHADQETIDNRRTLVDLVEDLRWAQTFKNYITSLVTPECEALAADIGALIDGQEVLDVEARVADLEDDVASVRDQGGLQDRDDVKAQIRSDF